MDHDQRFKVLIREFFREFIELFFPSWAKHFDFDNIDWLETEVFLEPPLGERRAVPLLHHVLAGRPNSVRHSTPIGGQSIT